MNPSKRRHDERGSDDDSLLTPRKVPKYDFSTPEPRLRESQHTTGGTTEPSSADLYDDESSAASISTIHKPPTSKIAENKDEMYRTNIKKTSSANPQNNKTAAAATPNVMQSSSHQAPKAQIADGMKAPGGALDGRKSNAAIANAKASRNRSEDSRNDIDDDEDEDDDSDDVVITGSRRKISLAADDAISNVTKAERAISTEINKSPPKTQKKRDSFADADMEVSSPNTTNNSSNDDDESSDDGEIRCICGRDSKGAFIACDDCDVWQHNVCMGLPEDENELPASYWCERCRPEDHEETLLALEDGVKVWEVRILYSKSRGTTSKRRKRRRSPAVSLQDGPPTLDDENGEEHASEPSPLSPKKAKAKVEAPAGHVSIGAGIVKQWAASKLNTSTDATPIGNDVSISDDSDYDASDDNGEDDLLSTLAKQDKMIYMLKEKNGYKSGVIRKCNERIRELEEEGERSRAFVETYNEESELGL